MKETYSLEGSGKTGNRAADKLGWIGRGRGSARFGR